MKIRKTAKANLENKKSIFFQIGLILALVLAFTAFEYKTYEKMTLQDHLRGFDNTFEEIIPITVHHKKPLPPPLPVIKINLVPDEVELVNDIEIDANANEETVIEIYVPDLIEEPEIPDDIVVKVPEVFPRFPEGIPGLKAYLGDNVNYPKLAKQLNIQGTVYVGFIVEKDGSISQVEILRSIGGGCDEEAIRVVQNMPQWSPGRQMNKPVRVSFTLPIKFTLRSL